MPRPGAALPRPSGLALILFLLLGGRALPAQEAAPGLLEVDSLTRVRVAQRTVSPRRIAGRLLYADSLVVTLQRARTGERVVLPLPAIDWLEVSAGPMPPEERLWRGARDGFWGGMILAGALLTAGTIIDLGGCGDCFITATHLALTLSVPLVTVTTVGGAVIGASSPGDRWRRAPLPLRLRSRER